MGNLDTTIGDQLNTQEKIGELKKVYAARDPSRTAIGLKEQSFHEKEAKAKSSIFVGGLRTITNEETLVKYFTKFGQVTFAEVKRLPDRSSRGFGFIQFGDPDAVQRIVHFKESHLIDGKC